MKTRRTDLARPRVHLKTAVGQKPAPVAPGPPSESTPVDPPFVEGDGAPAPPPRAASAPLPSLALGDLGVSVRHQTLLVPELAELRPRLQRTMLGTAARERFTPACERFAGQRVSLPELFTALGVEARPGPFTYTGWRGADANTVCTRLGLLTDDTAMLSQLFAQLCHVLPHDRLEDEPLDPSALETALSRPETAEAALRRIEKAGPHAAALLPAVMEAVRRQPALHALASEALAAHGPLAVEPLRAALTDPAFDVRFLSDAASQLGLFARPLVPDLLARFWECSRLPLPAAQAELIAAIAFALPDLTRADNATLSLLRDFLSRPYDEDLVPASSVQAATALLVAAGPRGVVALGEAYPARVENVGEGYHPGYFRAVAILERLEQLGPAAFPALPLLMGKPLFGSSFYRDLGPLSREQCSTLWDRIVRTGLPAHGLQMLERGGRDGARLALPALDLALQPETLDDLERQHGVAAAIRLMGQLGPLEGAPYVEPLMNILHRHDGLFMPAFKTLLELLTPRSRELVEVVERALLHPQAAMALHQLEQRPDLLASVRNILEVTWRRVSPQGEHPNAGLASVLTFTLMASGSSARPN